MDVDWDHPLVKQGIIPEHLAMEFFGYTNRRSFIAFCKKNKGMCKQVNRQFVFSVEAISKWIAETPSKSDED